MTHDINRLFQTAVNTHQSGSLDEARKMYNAILAMEPLHADSMHLLGVLEWQQGKSDQSVRYINDAIRIKPRVALYHNNLGNVYKEKGELQSALTSYARAVEINPTYAEAFCNSGLVLSLLGQYADARARLEYAIFLKPGTPEFHNTLGVILASEGNQEEAAIREYGKAISLRRDYADAYCNRGNALLKLGRHKEALVEYQTAVRLKPDYFEAISNMGNVYAYIGDYAKARELHETAIRINPSYAEAHNNLGFTLSEMGLYDDALASYRRALDINPEYPMANWNLACCLLLAGQYDPGWQQHEWRWRSHLPAGCEHKFEFSSPQWTGKEPLGGKTILLHAEQGLGDTIQFCRYAKLVQSLGASVILQVQPPLRDLIATLDPQIKVLSDQEPLPAFDYHCPLLSLPLAFKTDAESVPAPRRYLFCDPDRLRLWTERLGVKKRFRIGIVWGGNPGNTKDHRRSISLDQFMEMTAADADYICLQKELRGGEHELIKKFPHVQFVGEEIRDFSDTAALCELMDLVISVDTSVAHLAGALGKAVWILLSTNPAWRWLAHGEECAWYPTARLFRQSKPGDWSGVLAQVRNELNRVVAQGEPFGAV